MSNDTPGNLYIITPNDDGTFTGKLYEFDSVTKERKQVGESKKLRVATEEDREAHARGELKGRTRIVHKLEDFQPFMLVEVDG